jgi:alkanesulfonate monooxygenase SsuD/methylene tetrahydromethanopterin reductase-like flavin-dependent oxidoreductase (luciferase family)
MKFGFTMPNTVQVKALAQPFETDVTGPDQAAIARRAEELGYDMIPIPEHFVVPNSHVELTGSQYFHSTVAQAFIAGATQRIRIISTATLLPVQHPVILAKRSRRPTG